MTPQPPPTPTTFRPVTASDRPQHSGMTPTWFDQAVARSFAEGQQVRPGRFRGQWLVSSGSTEGVWYIATPRACGCTAGRQRGRCDHRARVAFESWLRETAAAEDHGTAA
jgi:hypothetical protein